MRTYHVHVRPGAFMPEYTDVHDAAAKIKSPEDYTILPGEKVTIKTGLHFRMPSVEFVQMLVPAQEMLRKEVMLFDSNRLIDTWDGGELSVTLWNTGVDECIINRGDVISKITIILNSHGSYVTAPWDMVVDTEMEQWAPEPPDEVDPEDGIQESWGFK